MREKRSRRVLHTKGNYLWFIVATGVLIGIGFAAKNVAVSNIKPRVLGESRLLADKGSDDKGISGESSSGGGSSGGGDSGRGGSSGGSGTGGGSERTGESTSGGGGGSGSGSTEEQRSSTRENAVVDCVGPDGRHSQTTFEACKEFNDAWKNTNFSFTVIKSRAPIKKEKVEQENETKNEQEQKEVEAKTQKGQKIELRTEEGVMKVKVEKADGTEEESELEENDLDEINKELASEDIEVSTTSAKGFAFSRGEVEAETAFPLSVNVTTKTFTVTTPTGIKDVAVLPDAAVDALLRRGIISRVAATGSIGSQGTPKTKVTLTFTNNQPAFEVVGQKDEQLFGVLPVTIEKISFVSAQNGTVIRTVEDLFNSILDAVSV